MKIRHPMTPRHPVSMRLYSDSRVFHFNCPERHLSVHLLVQCLHLSLPLCCSVLQCVAVRCSVLQCGAVCCSVCISLSLHRSLSLPRSLSHCVTGWCSVVQCVAVCCSVLHCVSACCGAYISLSLYIALSRYRSLRVSK